MIVRSEGSNFFSSSIDAIGSAYDSFGSGVSEATSKLASKDYTSNAAMADYSLIGSALNSVIGAYFSTQQSKLALNAQADLADINARMARMSAESALLQGQDQNAQISRQAGQLKSHQRASMAANGVDLGVGSAAEVQASTDVMKEADMNTVHANAVMKAWGFRTEAVNEENAALLKRAQAGLLSPAGAAVSSLMGSAGTVTEKWKKIPDATANTGVIQTQTPALAPIEYSPRAVTSSFA